uniref:Transposase (Putative), gypsy type n=1 Tax=Tanacetum cinerariifolium TaxID=118510 RepID=A0A6L2MLZ8_TANCI|nr:hypothetical protein [Tanacetum cinerariifolium]
MPPLLPRPGLLRVYTGLSGVWPVAACLTPQRLAKIWWTMSLLQVIFLSCATCITTNFEAVQCEPGPTGGDGVATATEVSGEEKLKAAFEEFKRYEDAGLSSAVRRYARLDALSIDFNEELYPHMLTAIAGRRWMIGHGLRLAVMKCGESLELRQAFTDVVSAGIAKGMSEGLRHGIEHGQAQLALESIEAYDPEAETKYIAALQALKDLKYPLVDQLVGLKDSPMDVIMAALYLKSDIGDDALHGYATSVPVLLNLPSLYTWSRAEKKKKCRIVCRTHGVGSAHHARYDVVPVSAPTVIPQGLAFLLADAATQTDTD